MHVIALLARAVLVLQRVVAVATGELRVVAVIVVAHEQLLLEVVNVSILVVVGGAVHGPGLTVAMWVFRGRDASESVVVREVFAWAVCAFLVLKFLCCLFSKGDVLAYFCHTHLLVGAVTDNSEFAHTAVKSDHIVFLYLWREGVRGCGSTS